jgi:hypothetical protein
MGGGKKAGGAIKLLEGGITDTDALESFAERLVNTTASTVNAERRTKG